MNAMTNPAMSLGYIAPNLTGQNMPGGAMFPPIGMPGFDMAS